MYLRSCLTGHGRRLFASSRKLIFIAFYQICIARSMWICFIGFLLPLFMVIFHVRNPVFWFNVKWAKNSYLYRITLKHRLSFSSVQLLFFRLFLTFQLQTTFSTPRDIILALYQLICFRSDNLILLSPNSREALKRKDLSSKLEG